MENLNLEQLTELRRTSLIKFADNLINNIGKRIENFDVEKGRLNKLTIEEYKKSIGVKTENRERDFQDDDEYILHDDSLEFMIQRIAYWKNIRFKLQYEFESLPYLN